MEAETSYHCINEPYLICDKDKNCFQCNQEENKINQKWINRIKINQDFNIIHTETEIKKIVTNTRSS